MAVEEVKEVSPQAEKVKVGSGLSFFEEGWTIVGGAILNDRSLEQGRDPCNNPSTETQEGSTTDIAVCGLSVGYETRKMLPGPSGTVRPT